MNGSSQSGSVIQWATVVEVPPPGSSSYAPSSQSSDHAASSPHPLSSFTKTSNLPMPNPQDHSDFVNSFLSSDEDFSPVTSESPLAVTEEDIWALLNATPFSGTFHGSLSLSQFGDVKAGSSTDNTCKAPGSLMSIKTNNEPNGEDVGITTVLGQSQDSAPNTFDKPENEVSTAQDTLLVNLHKYSIILKVLT